jgi:hypothetical protein
MPLSQLDPTNHVGRCTVSKYEMPIFCLRNSEKEFHQLHETILDRPNDSDVLKSVHWLSLYVSLLSGDIHHLRDPHHSISPLFKFDLGPSSPTTAYSLKNQIMDATLTHRLTQPDLVVDVRDVRDELFVTLCHGVFSSDSARTERNVEITARLVSERGEVLTNCLVRGTGKQIKSRDQFSSSVHYHDNKPIYEETFCIDLSQVQQQHQQTTVLNCHLLLLIGHCSFGTASTVSQLKSTFLGKKKEQLFAFSYLPLKDRHSNVILGNGDHFISCYSIPEDSQLLLGERITPFYLQEMSLTSSPSASTSPSFSSSASSSRSSFLAHSNSHSSFSGTPSAATASPKPRQITADRDEYLKLRVYVSSKKFTVRQEMHELFEWKNITEKELELTLLNCLNSSISDDLLTSILHTSLAIVSGKPNLRSSAYQLFLRGLTQFQATIKNSKRLKSSSSIPSSMSAHESHSSHSIHSLLEETNKWIEPLFGQDSHLSVTLLSCLWEGLQALEKVSPHGSGGTPSSSLFRRNLLQTAPVILTIALSHVGKDQQQGESDRTQLKELSLSIINHLSCLQPLDPDLFSTLRSVYTDAHQITFNYLEEEEEESMVTTLNYLSTLHRPFNRSLHAIKQDKYIFLSHLIESESFLSSPRCQQKTIEPIVTILRDQFLSDSFDREPYALLLSLIGISSTNTLLIESLTHLLSSFLVAVVRLLGGTVDEWILHRRDSRILFNRGGTSPSVLSSPPVVNPLLLENAMCCLCGLLRLVGQKRLYQLIGRGEEMTRDHEQTEEEEEGRDELSDLESEFVYYGVPGLDGKNIFLVVNLVLTLFLKREVFPSTWLVLKMSYVNHISDYLAWVSEYLDTHKEELLSPTALSHYWQFDFKFPSLGLELNIDPPVGAVAGPSRAVPPDTHSVNNLILWSSTFNLSLFLLLDPEVSVSINSKRIHPVKRSYLLEHYSTIGEPVMNSLLRCWKSLTSDSLKLKFIPIFTIPILALTCSSSDPTPLSDCGITLLTDLLTSDYSHNQQFNLTSPHIYDCVCLSVLHTPSHTQHTIEDRYLPSIDSITRFLRHGLQTLFQHSPILNTLNSSALSFVSEMRDLLTLLLNLSKSPETIEYEEERAFAYHKLMTFFQKVGRVESWVKTTHNFAREMIKFENFLEAGNLIRLHVDLLEWSDTLLEAIDLGGGDESSAGGSGSGGTGGGVGGLGFLPSEQSSRRKIHLIRYAMSVYEQAKAYEECLELLHELVLFYQLIEPDYGELILVMNQQVECYSKIITVDRYYPTLFRVGYYGQGVDNELIRNKEFIYKGALLESLGDFCNRIKKKYPSYELLPPKVTPSPEDHFLSDKAYLQISKVTPLSPSPSHPPQPALAALPVKRKSLETCPSYVKDYERNQRLQTFFFQKIFRKTATKSSNEFLDLWVERRILTTEACFPSISRRSVVVSCESVIFNPVEMAVQGIQERNQELRERNLEMQGIADGQAGQAYTRTLRSPPL